MTDTLVPPAQSDDDDDVVLALETARAEEERGQPGEAARWVQRAAGAARKQGRPNRAGELSRAQAMLSEVASKFQKAVPGEQVLDSDDDFSEHTIVDRSPALIAQERAPEPPQTPSPARPSAPPPPPRVNEETPKPVHESAQPQLPVLPVHSGIRVAVRKVGGAFEARPLREGEKAGPREDEALMVPLRPGARFQ